jgi:hypothetical protein
MQATPRPSSAASGIVNLAHQLGSSLALALLLVLTCQARPPKLLLPSST